MTKSKKFGITIFVILIGIQFVRPEKNAGIEQVEKNITSVIEV